MRLREFNDRTIECKRRYWDIRKDKRIQLGLRQEVGAVGYSGAWAVECAEELVAKGLRGICPFECDSNGAWVVFQGPKTFNAPEEVVALLEPLLANLEKLLPDERS